MNRAECIDAFVYLKSLRFARVLNALKILFSYYRSKITKKNYHWGNPVAISIEPTTSCNLRCPQCPSGLRSFSRPTGMLQPDLNKKIIDELSRELTYITYYFQGEPYLNKDFLKMVSYATKNNIYTATSTNAHYLSKEIAEETVTSGLKRLIISIDGIEQDSYSKYRIGGDLEKVVSGTRELMAAKKRLRSKTPFVIWQFIVFRNNEHEVGAVKKLAKEIGVDKLALKSAQIYDYALGSDLIPKNKKYSRYIKEGLQYKIKNGLLNHCWRMWHSCVVTWDGKVVPCCFDKDASYRLGQLQENTFTSIWRGEGYQRFRKVVLKSRSNIDICRNCSEGTKVWL